MICHCQQIQVYTYIRAELFSKHEKIEGTTATNIPNSYNYNRNLNTIWRQLLFAILSLSKILLMCKMKKGIYMEIIMKKSFDLWKHLGWRFEFGWIQWLFNKQTTVKGQRIGKIRDEYQHSEFKYWFISKVDWIVDFVGRSFHVNIERSLKNDNRHH